jgi:hypothetical protein
MRRGLFVASALAALMLVATRSDAYSVLTHQAAIDAAWDSNIRPLLLRRFPRSSSDDLMRARSYAYGGSVIQDLGYYPFGSHFFSNLLHYVRSGDFVEALVREATDVNEYAFALGALAHYTNDMTGHPLAVNKAVPMSFAKLRKKYGPDVTYVEAPSQHVIVEFSFDVVQAAGGKYLPDAYRQFIGFRVATPALERAFRDIYGLELGDVLSNQDRAVGTFRYAVSQLVPALTEAAWRDKRDEIEKLTPGVERSRFVFTYGPSDYEREYRARLPETRMVCALRCDRLSHRAEDRPAETAGVQGADRGDRCAVCRQRAAGQRALPFRVEQYRGRPRRLSQCRFRHRRAVEAWRVRACRRYVRGAPRSAVGREARRGAERARAGTSPRSTGRRRRPRQQVIRIESTGRTR